MRDNGMLNSRVMRLCGKLGHQHPNDIVPHFRDHNIIYPNAAGLRLEYWRLSSSEQEFATICVLAEMFPYSVDLPSHNREDRHAIDALLEHGWVFQPWTHLMLWAHKRYADQPVTRFYFSDHVDAIKFKLLT